MGARIDWLDVNGVSLRYALEGTGDQAIVLLHEMGGSLETWDKVVPRLAGYRILRYDMRGAGLSQKVSSLTLDDLVADLGAVLDSLDIGGPVILAGVAVSAAVAAAFAARFPARVVSLVLMSLAAGIPPERREATAALARSIREGGLRARVDARLEATFPRRFRDDDRWVRDFRGRALGNDPASYAAYYDMLLSLDLSKDLAAIRCPTLVLAGSDDGTRTPERVAQDACAIPDMSFQTISSGHVMPVLTPALVAEAIQAFSALPAGLPLDLSSSNGPRKVV